MHTQCLSRKSKMIVKTQFVSRVRRKEIKETAREIYEDIAAGNFVIETAQEHKKRMIEKYGLSFTD